MKSCLKRDVPVWLGAQRCLFYLGLVLVVGAESHLDTVIADEPRVLNNFVTELVRASDLVDPEKPSSFTLSRPRWVFIRSVAGATDQGRIVVAVDSPDTVVYTHTPGSKPEREAMRYLRQGDHRVLIRGEGSATLESLTVRTIPELLFYSCRYGHLGLIEHSPYDQAYLESLIRKNVNHLIVDAGRNIDPSDAESWANQGRRWIGGCGISWGSEQENYDYWAQHYRNNTFLNGLIADEFCPRARITNGKPRFFPSQYRACTRALQRIRSEGAFRGKRFFAYIGDWHRYIWEEDAATREFIRDLMDADDRSSWERYFREQPSKGAAEKYLKWNLTQPVQAWSEEQPGIRQHLIVCLCLTTLPGHNLNIYPHVDYKVWMEMQVRRLATDPALADLAGLMWWGLGLTDEETVRWASRLMRHYAIEGNTQPVSHDPYELRHLKNPDFDQQMTGWNIQPAEAGSIAARHSLGFGNRVEGRVGVTAGNNVLWIKRSDKRPNLIIQKVRKLEPGRFYSAKVFESPSTDPDSTAGSAPPTPMRVAVHGADVLPNSQFCQVFSRPNDVQLNYHWLVFRARSTTAQLQISDWQATDSPGGPIGQETVLSSVEVQPYLKE